MALELGSHKKNSRRRVKKIIDTKIACRDDGADKLFLGIVLDGAQLKGRMDKAIDGSYPHRHLDSGIEELNGRTCQVTFLKN
ncbi:hypothetical protein JTE90_000827 [Oedothorax gibbosus]|uniref:Uncharacterized protein n=1 Tax=Oedothorax gibbosus TaxID=931172 RepID=A0AAV6VSS1_9ARAC|nr:hypothetical protein JTE90_000827 [Oedothorax gibbosus]